jgi:hypothetical protein
MKSYLILTLAILFTITFRSLYGQAYPLCKCTENVNIEPNLPGELYMPAKEVDTVTYFNRDWLLGDIFLSNGEIVRNKYIKYNGLLDELFWLEPKSKKTVMLDKEAILQFHFLNIQGDTSVYFRKLLVERSILNDTMEIFGQTVYNGEISLSVIHTFYIKHREIVSTTNGIFQKDTYAEEPVYFMKFIGKSGVVLKKLNRKNLYTFFTDKKDKIKQFFKQIKKHEIVTWPDMIMLMKYLNSITDQ